AHHELVGLRSTHGSRVRFYYYVLQPAAVENPTIGVVMLQVRNVQAGSVDIEGIRILHGELPHSQQPRSRPRLIAKLGLNLVPDPGERRVAAQFVAGNSRHDLLFRQAQAERGSGSARPSRHAVGPQTPATTP